MSVKIEHVALYAWDPEAVRDFFEKYLHGRSGSCYRNQKTGFRSYFVSFDDGARLEIMNRPGMTDPPHVPYGIGYSHVAFSLGSREEVDELTERLRIDGFSILSGPRVTGDGYYESAVAVGEIMIELTV